MNLKFQNDTTKMKAQTKNTPFMEKNASHGNTEHDLKKRKKTIKLNTLSVILVCGPKFRPTLNNHYEPQSNMISSQAVMLICVVVGPFLFSSFTNHPQPFFMIVIRYGVLF